MRVLDEFFEKHNVRRGDCIIVKNKDGKMLTTFTVYMGSSSKELHLNDDSPEQSIYIAIAMLFNADTSNIIIRHPIKPCPFCGGQNLEVTNCFVPTNGKTKEVVLCHDCKTTGPIKDTRNEAIKAWNKAKR